MQICVTAEVIRHRRQDERAAGIEFGQPQPCPDRVEVEHSAQHLAECLGAFPAQRLPFTLKIGQFECGDGGDVPHGKQAQRLASFQFKRDQVTGNPPAQRDGHRHAARVGG